MPAGGVNAAVDLSINLTTIIAIIVWLVTVAVAWAKFGGRLDMLEFRVTRMEEALSRIATVLEKQNTNERQLVVFGEQLAAVQKEHSTLYDVVEALRRGDGWITGPRRANLDGEYSRP